MMQRRQRVTWWAIVLLFVVPLVWGCKDQSLVVQTDSGVIKGTQDERVKMFLGVPFAKPPVGDLRWQAPVDPEPWEGILDATESGCPCTQFEMSRTWHPTGAIIGSEDCLYLDVYRPKNNKRHLPVYFWIHGGSNKFGSAATYAENAIAMAENLDVVVVVTQYRLGPFGWFRYAGMRDTDPQNPANSGNFGTLDHIQALTWVQRNIAAFGGDPDNVTIAGQSAGGHNVKNLLISPLAAGLFHKVVSQSGIMPVIDAADTTAEMIIADLGLQGSDIAGQLRDADAEAILDASQEVSTFSAFADGYVLPDTVVNAVYQGKYNPVPVILGANHNEFYNFLPLYGAALGKPEWDNVHDLFDPAFDPDNDWTYADIFPNASEEALYQTAGRYASDGYRAKYLDELAGVLRDRQEAVYGYVFKWAGGGVPKMEPFSKVFGAAHSMEIPFFFGSDRSLFGYAFIEENETGRKALQRVMQTYLYNFMTTGDPGKAQQGMTWEPWSREEGAFKAITFDADSEKAILNSITDDLTFDDVNAALAAELATWDPAFAAAWGWLPGVFSQSPETIRFAHLLDFEAVEGATAFSGIYGYDVDALSVYHLAGYRMEIPAGWDPSTDGLVLYCHGYRGDDPQLSVTNPETLRRHLLSRGYAWAASSYGENGYNIATGVVGTRQLLRLISARFGAPKTVYIIGHSMGGHVTARSVTEYPNVYDGAMPMCGVVGGGIEQFSYSLDWALLANYFSGLNAGLPFDPLQAGGLVDAVFGAADAQGQRSGQGVFGYIPPYGPTYYEGRTAVLNSTGQFFKEATKYRSGGERPLYDVSFANTAFFQIASQGIDFAVDPTGGGGTGNAVDNENRTYQLDGVAELSDVETDLNNGIQRIGLDDDDIDFDYEMVMYPVYGNIDIPVLSLHDIGDFFVPFEHERIYARKVADAARSDLLRTRIFRSIGHCGFTPAETAASFDDLTDWVESGVAPVGDDVLDADLVAADDFGCQFTMTRRAEDRYVDGDGVWICE